MEMNVVQTNGGLVRGCIGKREGVLVFKKIPFAKPPIGERRFLPADTNMSWTGELFSDRYSDACIQEKRDFDNYEISEDCLYLNVYTPAKKTDEKLPVLVWIYGGGFKGGNSVDPEFDGEALASKGAVVITFNYRCSIYGFFSTKELEKRTGVSVNIGFLDQIAALQWVNENIEGFGGDKKKITIFGQSAGGVSVRMHLVSPLSKGLFSRAMVESGGGLNEADLVRNQSEFQEMCQKCMDMAKLTLDDLYTGNAEENLIKMEVAAKELLQNKELALFQPFKDGYTLLDVPGKSIARGEFQNLPIICGTVAGDSWMFSRKVKNVIPNQKYFKGFAIAPSQSWGKRQIELKKPPIYTYYMDRTQPKVEQKGYTHGAHPFGADTPHGTEIAYLFGNLEIRDCNYEELDFHISEELMKYVIHFADTGNPNGTDVAEWKPYEEPEYLTLHIGDNGIEMENITGADEERAVTFTMKHPGMLTNLEGF